MKLKKILAWLALSPFIGVAVLMAAMAVQQLIVYVPRAGVVVCLVVLCIGVAFVGFMYVLAWLLSWAIPVIEGDDL